MDYTLAFAKPVGGISTSILIVRKNRPAFQAGKYNLPGGKLEFGEAPIPGAERELLEETGLKPILPSTLMGAITGSWGNVYCVKVPVFEKVIIPSPTETEEFFWKDWSELKLSGLLMPNLQVIIPLFMTDTTDWIVEDEGPSWGNVTHTIKVTVNV